MGIKCLKNLTDINSDYIQDHQVFIVNCLQSEDDTIRRITLNLLYNNTNAVNLKVITEKFMKSLKTTSDVQFKKSLT